MKMDVTCSSETSGSLKSTQELLEKRRGRFEENSFSCYLLQITGKQILHYIITDMRKTTKAHGYHMYSP
jgi:hypothetical protein